MTIVEKLRNNKDYIAEKIRNGATTTEIAKEFECNSGSVYFFLKDNGIELINQRLSRKYKEKFKEKIVELYLSGLSCYRISKELGISKSDVLRWLKSWGYNTNKYNKNIHGIKLKDRVDEVVRLHLDGLNASDIGRQLGYSSSQISILLNKLGYQLTNCTYTVNENFFDTIDTEVKAYCLGFWYADGCVDERGVLRLGLAEKDKSILERIKLEMEYSGPLHYTPAVIKAGYLCQPQYHLNICRQKLAKQLINKGCFPNKSFNISFPNSNVVPDHLIRHFIRGVFDGDGSINKKTRSCNITGYGPFMIEIGEFIKSNFGIEYKLQDQHRGLRDNRTKQLRFNRKETKLFLDYIYRNSSIYLERKFNLYQAIIARKEPAVLSVYN